MGPLILVADSSLESLDNIRFDFLYLSPTKQPMVTFKMTGFGNFLYIVDPKMKNRILKYDLK